MLVLMSQFEWFLAICILVVGGGLLLQSVLNAMDARARRRRVDLVADEKTRGSLARKLGKTPHEWLVELLHDLREAGLFQDKREMTDEDLATHVEKQLREDWGEEGSVFPIDPTDELSALLVASFDKSRVWYDDLEADVCAENQVYARDLPVWGRISCGAFQPESIVETWEGDEGPITVEFTLDGARHAVHPAFHDDWEDVEVLGAVNALIKESGRQFVAIDTGDQCGAVMAVTPEERKILSGKCGLRIEDIG